MKALSVKNPWPMLIALGIKDIENRTWRTEHRGRIYLHSTAVPDPRHRDMSVLFTKPQWGQILQHNLQLEMAQGTWLNSSIIGEAELVGCVRNHPSIWAEPDCWHWVLENPVLYKNPITNVKGALSLWEYKK